MCIAHHNERKATGHDEVTLDQITKKGLDIHTI